MAVFCNNCGAQLADGTKFCNKCGAAVSAGLGKGPSASSPVAPAPQGGSSTALKVILAIVGVFVFIGVLMAGSCFYIGYRVKKRAHEFTQEMGGSVAPYTGKREPCAMLPSDAVAQAVGRPVTSVEQSGVTICTYHFGPGNPELAVTYTWQGGAMSMKLAQAAMRQVAGMQTLTPVPGVGDEAYLTPMGSGLMLRKGDVMVNLDMRANGVSVDAGKKMAAEIASKL